MHHKRPHPIVLASPKPRRLCPVCGEVSYSREGIHPQCAQQQADAPRVARLKAARQANKSKPKAVNPDALSPWHKRCPKCRAQVHVRKLTCDCGHPFGEPR